MYYAFFETRDEAEDGSFFSHIADAFCTIVVMNIMDLYKSKAFSHSNIIKMDWETMEAYFEKNGGSLYFLNCQIFPDRLNCENGGCKTGHRAVLTLNQVDKLAKIIKIKKDAVLRAQTEPRRDRINLQTVFQKYETANKSQIDIIPMEENITHDVFLENYVTRTSRRIRNKPDAQGFVYIRAGINSDYDYFVEKTDIPNVMACDCLQGVTV